MYPTKIPKILYIRKNKLQINSNLQKFISFLYYFIKLGYNYITIKSDIMKSDFFINYCI